MGNKNISEKVRNVVLNILNNREENEIELFDVKFVKEGPNYYLRVFIDREKEGVFIKDCVELSRELEILLDEKDYISQPYILEVSSPGADRPLRNSKDFEKYKGKIIDIKLYKSLNGKKEFQSELVELVDGVLKVKTEDEEMQIDMEQIATCRLAVIFN